MDFESQAIRLTRFAAKALESAPDDDIAKRAKIEKSLRQQSKRHLRIVEALKKNHLHDIEEEDLRRYLMEYPNMAAFHARHRWRNLLIEDSGLSKSEISELSRKRGSRNQSGNSKKKFRISEDKSLRLKELVKNIEMNTRTVKDMLENEVNEENAETKKNDEPSVMDHINGNSNADHNNIRGLKDRSNISDNKNTCVNKTSVPSRVSQRSRIERRKTENG